MHAEDPATRGARDRVARLSEDDADAIDRLFEHGLKPSETNDPRERAALDLLSCLESYPTEEASDELVDATLARIGRAESERSSRFSIADAPGFNGRQIRLPDFFAVAAALFLAVGIGWPLYQAIDRQNDILHSKVRLNEYSAGIASFASENDGSMPIDVNTIEGSGHSMSGLPDAMDGDWGTQLHKALTTPALHVSPDFEQAERIRLEKIGPISYRVPMNIGTFKLTAYGADEPLLADQNPVIWSKRRNQPALSHRQGSHIHDQTLVVVVRFDLSFDSLPSAVLPDGDSLWVHDDYDPDVPSANEDIRPRNLKDAVLAH